MKTHIQAMESQMTQTTSHAPRTARARLMARLTAAALGAAVGVVGAGLTAEPARAQSSTTGAVKGQVKDQDGAPLAGVVVTAASPSLQGTQSAFTEDNGTYLLTGLPPGDYVISFFYGESQINKSGVNVGVAKTTSVFQTINTEAAAETINIVAPPSTIDTTKANQGITLDTEYLKNIPVPGRTFEDALGAAAGSQGDGLGVSFSGSSSLENQYIVDGVNTTGLQFGTVGSPVINDFLEEIEVITGGYGAEFGRATGGVVQAVTKSGSNEFKGSVFGYFRNDAMIGDVERSPIQVASIDFENNIDYDTDFGFDLGGPIIKDRLWFYVGFGPQLTKVTTTRRTKTRTDCRVVLDSGELSECNAQMYQDGQPDVDPATNFYITDDIVGGTRDVESSSMAYSMLAKLNFNVSPEHQGQISFIGQPFSGENRGIFGLPDSTSEDYTGITSDVALKWTSKFNDDRTEVEGTLGWHYAASTADAINNALNSEPGQIVYFQNLGVLSGFGAESQATRNRCIDNNPDPNNPDPYPLITNCPDDGAAGYSIGGPGSIGSNSEQRLSAKIVATHRVPDLLGSHEFKVGGDAEDNVINSSRRFSGGAFIQNYGPSSGDFIRVLRWVQLAPGGSSEARFDNTCRDRALDLEFQCDYLEGTEGYPGTEVIGNTFNWSAFAQDSWQPKPNLTINLGVRYEEQRLRYAEDLQNTVDALTGDALGKNALTLNGMFAPRLGVVYDWTKVAKGKVYGHYGRFYESIPLQINDRSFGGEVLQYSDYEASTQCGPAVDAIGAADGRGCLVDPTVVPAVDEFLFGSSGVLVAPDLKAQYLDEVLGGVEYEIMDDLKLGLSVQKRWMGRVIEDVSTDGAQTYIIANPGEWSEEAEADFQAKIDRTDDPDEKDRLEDQLRLYQGIRIFDKPRRDYTALQFTASQRFSKNFYAQASYTFSRVQGNYPGLISYDNGQVDPNISSQYDLIELLANRNGPLPTDRPHYIKIDGYYNFDFKKAGTVTLGARIRALSGTPKNALGGHYRYGPDESFLIPRGEIGRTDFEHGVDLRMAYSRDLGRGMNLSVLLDLFNVYNRQGQASVDNTYALAYPDRNVNPISGGTYEDLIWAKSIDDAGNETPDPVVRNANFGNTAGRYSPIYAQLGVRLTF
ncbi:MAG: TonB-dependent receptor [Kofleriaceae bacterium]